MGKWKKLLLIGDSNMQFGFSDEGRWVSLLANHLQRKCDVINRGFSGYNSKHLKIIVPQVLEEFEPQTTCGVIILLGSNDSAKEGSIQHVPLKEYRENIESIVDYITRKWGLSKDKLILITAPRINNAKWEQESVNKGRTSNHFDELAIKYAAECRELGGRNGIPVFDLNRLMSERVGGYSDLLSDGLHFSELGSKFLAENLVSMIDASIGKDLVFNYPYWMDIDLDSLKQ